MGLSSTIRAEIGAVLFMAAPFSFAQQSDLRLQATFSGEVVTQTRTVDVEFNATNLGPDAATNVAASSIAVFPFDGTQLTYAVAPGCTISSSGPASAQILSWQIGSLAAGAQRQCRMTLRALPTTVQQSEQFGLRISGSEPDPSSSNNTAGRLLAISPVDVVSDIAIELAVQPASGVIPRDGSGRLLVRIQNFGPDNAQVIQAISDLYPSPFFPPYPFELFLVPEDPCNSRVDVELTSSQTLVGPIGFTLPAGASVTCVLGIDVPRNVATVSYDLAFRSALTSFGALDPNPGNDVGRIRLQLSPPPVAAPALSPTAIAFLVVIILLCARTIGRIDRN